MAGVTRASDRHRGSVRGPTRPADHARGDGWCGKSRGTMTSPMDIDAPVAPPRANGELVFADPWDTRAFLLDVSQHKEGMFTRNQFQAELITRLASWEQS